MSEQTEVLDPPVTTIENTAWLFFKKIMLQMPFYIDRKPVDFEPLDGNIGVLRVSADDPLAAGLLAAARANGGRGTGGIVQIDEQTLEALKKKHPFKLLAPRSKQPAVRVFNPVVPSPKSKGKNGAVAEVVSRISGRVGVDLVGGGGADDESGKVSPVPAPPPAAPGEFVPATKRKSEFKMPVLKKASGRSLHSLAPDEPETAGAE